MKYWKDNLGILDPKELLGHAGENTIVEIDGFKFGINK